MYPFLFSLLVIVDQPELTSYVPSMHESVVNVEPEVNEHYLGVNSPYLGEDLTEGGNDVLIRPSSVQIRE